MCFRCVRLCNLFEGARGVLRRLLGLERFSPIGRGGCPRARKVVVMNFSVNYAIVDYHGPSECNCVDHVLGLTKGTMGLLLFPFVGHIS